MPYKTFETDRLKMRPVSAELDAAFIFELLNSPKWLINIGDRNIKSIDDAAAYINSKMTPQLEKLGYGNYVVIRKEDGIKIGTCGLYDREGVTGIDIGFAFLPQYEKKGYAYESTSELLAVAINFFEISQISGIAIKENIASQNLLKRLGFEFNKIIKIPNDEAELMLFELKS